MAVATLTAPVKPLYEKFSDLEDAMNGVLVERNTEVRGAIVALVGGVHHLTVGEPGIAKSLLPRTLADLITAMEDAYFEYLLTAFTTDSEIIGPPSLKALEEDIYRRITTGKLPEAYWAFLDELFKGNSAILNALLTILNERIIHNDGKHTVPLVTVFAASNEFADGRPELLALQDRFHLQFIAKRISEPGAFIEMLRRKSNPKPEPVLAWSDVVAAHAEVAKVVLPDEIYEALGQLRLELGAAKIEPTDRRFAESLKVIRATTFLNGRTEAEIDDLRMLQHMLWTRPDEIGTVRKIVLGLASPIDRDGQALLENVEMLWDEYERILADTDNQLTKNTALISLHGRVNEAKAEFVALRDRASNSRRPNETIQMLRGRLLGLLRVVLVHFAVPGEKVDL